MPFGDKFKEAVVADISKGLSCLTDANNCTEFLDALDMITSAVLSAMQAIEIMRYIMN